MNKNEKAALYALLRELISLRDGEHCLRCGKRDRLQLSHIYPKGTHRRMEFEPDNLKFLCVGCHLFFWHKSPVEAWAWLESAIPKKRIDRLRLQASVINKSPFDVKLHILWLKDEIRGLKKSR